MTTMIEARSVYASVDRGSVDIALLPPPDQRVMLQAALPRGNSADVTLTIENQATSPRTIAIGVERADIGPIEPWIMWSIVTSEAHWGPASDPAPEILPATMDLEPGETVRLVLRVTVTVSALTRPGDYHMSIIVAPVDGLRHSLPLCVRLHHPASGLIGYLPSIYHPDDIERHPERSEAFLNRFLVSFEDTLRPIQQTIAAMFLLFDPMASPSDFLPWLATWTGAISHDAITEFRRRHLIRNAIRLFHVRGTPYGLRTMIELCTGFTTQVIDLQPAAFRIGASAVLGRTALGSIPDNGFIVRIEVDRSTYIPRDLLQSLIEMNRPVQATYEVEIVSSAD